MNEATQFRLTIPLPATFEDASLLAMSAVGEVIIDLRDAAASEHPDRVRIGVARRVDLLHECADEVTLRLNPIGTRYFDEDIIQFVQLLESGIDRMLLSGSVQAEVEAASELLDEMEGRFPVADPVRLGVRISHSMDRSELEGLCATSDRVDVLVLDSAAVANSMGDLPHRDGTIALARLRDTVGETASKRAVEAIGGPRSPWDPSTRLGYHDLLRDSGFTGGWWSDD